MQKLTSLLAVQHLQLIQLLFTYYLCKFLAGYFPILPGWILL